MCILFIYRKKNSAWPLLIATNRDEFYKREFYSPGFHWNGYPYIYAGKDKIGGGSWLGINKFGLCVAILNRKTNIQEKDFETRGSLVINALKFKSAIEAKDQIIKSFKKKYRFFNLFISDIKDAFLIKYQK